MAKVVVSESYLEDIADAIRAKNGTSDTYTPAQMATAISNISGGGGGGSTPNLQSKSVSFTPSETAQSQTVTADTGYDGLDEVSISVAAIPSSGSSMNVQAYIGQANTNQQTYTATALTLTVAKTGTYTVSWSGWRNTTSGTSGTQLYLTRGGATTAVGSANTSFALTNYGQLIELTGQSFQKDDVITVYARARNTSYQMYVANLVIVQTA